MASYEKQQKQEAEYPIPVSLFPMAHCPVKIYKDVASDLHAGDLASDLHAADVRFGPYHPFSLQSDLLTGHLPAA